MHQLSNRLSQIVFSILAREMENFNIPSEYLIIKKTSVSNKTCLVEIDELLLTKDVYEFISYANNGNVFMQGFEIKIEIV